MKKKTLLGLKHICAGAIGLTPLTQQEEKRICGGKLASFDQINPVTLAGALATTLVFMLSSFKLVNLYISRYQQKRYERRVTFKNIDVFGYYIPKAFKNQNFFTKIHNMYRDNSDRGHVYVLNEYCEGNNDLPDQKRDSAHMDGNSPSHTRATNNFRVYNFDVALKWNAFIEKAKGMDIDGDKPGPIEDVKLYKAPSPYRSFYYKSYTGMAVLTAIASYCGWKQVAKQASNANPPRKRKN